MYYLLLFLIALLALPTVHTQGCPITYRDPPAVDIVPVSPSIPQQAGGAIYNYATSNWFYRESYAGNMANMTKNVTTGEIVVTQSPTLNNENVFWLLCTTCLPYIRTNVNYQFFMGFKQHPNNPNLNASNIASIQVAMIKNIGWPNNFWILQNITNSTDKILVKSNIYGSFNVTEYQTFSTPLFTVPEPLWTSEFAWDKRYSNTSNFNRRHLTIGIRIQLTTANVGAPTFYFKDLKLIKSAENFQPLTQLNSTAERVSIPKPDWITLPQNRTNCPWDEVGLLAWHDPATWGGSVPSPSSNITLPANSKVLVTSCSLNKTAVYNKITIPEGSELIFSDANITLQIGSIVVNGKLRIGSETCRVYSYMTFTFVGASTSEDIMGGNMGAKGVGVSPTGSIDVHGKLYQHTWTRLKRTAWPGDDRVVLQDPVNWEPGQKVFITTTIIHDEWWNQNEILTVRAVSDNIVQFTTPIKYFHYGGKEYQAEVGLLSRRIVFQGDDQSETSAFGGHVIVRGEGRFSGVQAYRMGQKNRIARYPFHFHHMQEAPESYFQDCSCLHTYFRCITIHGTNNATVTKNVALDVTGNCYYLEDGVEERNTFSFNLAAYVHVIGRPAAGAIQDGEYFDQSTNLSQPADTAAAGFYITNAYNKFIGNAASGGWTGYSFPNLPAPIGTHTNVSIVPQNRPNLIFDGNTAHSTGYEWISGACVYVGGKLWLPNGPTGSLKYGNGRFARQTSGWMKVTNSRLSLCYAGFNHWGERLDIVGYEGHDVGRAGTIFGDSSIQDALVEGFSANPITGQIDAQGFQFYDTWTKSIIVDTTFRNYNPRVPTPASKFDDNYVFISMTHSDLYKPQGISATRNISYVNVHPNMTLGHVVANTGASRYFNFVDYDGSATGSTVPTIVGSHSDWWYISHSCRKQWGVWVCPKESYDIANLYINVGSNCGNPASGTSVWIGNTTIWGDGIDNVTRSAPFTACPGVTGVTNKGWYLFLNNGSAQNWTIYTYNLPNWQPVYLAARYPNTTQFNISTNNVWGSDGDGPVNKASNWTEFRNSNGNKYFWDGDYLILKCVNRLPPSPAYYERRGARVYTLQNNYLYIVRATECGGSGNNCDFRPDQAPSYLL